MIKIRYWIRDVFGFPRSQVNGFLVLAALLAVLVVSEPLWHWWISNRARDARDDKAMLDSMVALWKTIDTTTKTPIPSPQELSKFNPNDATEDQLVSLGFSRPLAGRIIRYREKGGEFRTKSDLLKIYGVDSAFYRDIRAYITLPEIAHKSSKFVTRYPGKTKAEIPQSRAAYDLNKADTSALKAIKGIGEKLSLRIVKYRDILGGFTSMDQLKEVYGLDSMVIRRLVEASFIDEKFLPSRLDINRATEKELSAHPYIKKMAKVIVSYRFQHGDFKTVEDIRTVINLEEKDFRKVAPYLLVTED